MYNESLKPQYKDVYTCRTTEHTCVYQNCLILNEFKGIVYSGKVFFNFTKWTEIRIVDNMKHLNLKIILILTFHNRLYICS